MDIIARSQTTHSYLRGKVLLHPGSPQLNLPFSLFKETSMDLIFQFLATTPILHVIATYPSVAPDSFWELGDNNGAVAIWPAISS